MKKSLFAIAAVTAFAGAAQAQSSVTIYGILDVGFRGDTTNVSQGANPYKTNTTSFNGVGNETTSRLGFRGTEDLGGGMSAFFTAEMSMNPAESNQFTAMANRQTFVGLGKKGLGRVAVGTQYTPIHLAVGATDPGQQNNMRGNAIYTTNAVQGNAETTTSYTVRLNNSITAQTDSFAGFKAYAIYGNNTADRTQYATEYTTTNASNGGNVNNTAYGIGLNYTWKKLYATAAYQSVKNENAQATSATVAGVNGTDNQMYAAATYDFGILKAYAQYVDRKVTSNINSNQYAKRSAQQLGVRSMITPKVEGWASIGTGRYAAFGTSSPTANFSAYQVGSNYYLSKRTNLYAIFGSTQTSSTSSTGAISGNNYAVGVRHRF